MKWIVILLQFIAIQISFALDKHEAEIHPQEYYPPIIVKVNGSEIQYYNSESRKEKIEFMKSQVMNISGEIPLSGYIFARDFVDSIKIKNSLAISKKEAEFLTIFSENSPSKMAKFLISVNERRKTAENDKELGIITRLIEKEGTEDDPASTPFFPTGFVEIKSPTSDNMRYFIRSSDINKSNLLLNPNTTKIQLLKAITIYSFQTTSLNINWGDIKEGTPEHRLLQDLESANNSLCALYCQHGYVNALQLATYVSKALVFDLVMNQTIGDDSNRYALAMQYCLLKNFNEGCASVGLAYHLNLLSKSEVIMSLIHKHKTIEELCGLFTQSD